MLLAGTQRLYKAGEVPRRGRRLSPFTSPGASGVPLAGEPLFLVSWKAKVVSMTWEQ